MFNHGDIVECVKQPPHYPFDDEDRLVTGALYCVDLCVPCHSTDRMSVLLQGMFFGMEPDTDAEFGPLAELFILRKRYDPQLLQSLLHQPVVKVVDSRRKVEAVSEA